MSVHPGRLLAHGIGEQIRNDSTGAVAEIVRYVLAERPAVRLLDRGIRAARSTRVPDYFAVANGARCWLRLRATGEPGGVLACAHRPNERRAIAWLKSVLPPLPWSDAEFGLRGAGVTLRAVPPGVLAHLTRTAHLARDLRREHDIFHVLRVVELLYYYDRIGRLLDEGRYRVAVMSTWSNPWGIALNLAAGRRGIPVVHVMHGAPLWPIPRLDYSMVIVNDEASAQVIYRAGCRVGRTIVKSSQANFRPLPARFPSEPLSVGILLSKQPVQHRVRGWITGLLQNPRVGAVVVRPHPLNLWRGLESTLALFPRDRVVRSSGPAQDDLRRCDLVIAGNSSVHLDALTAGVPSVYAAGLDTMSGDVLPFVSDGLVYPAGEPHDLNVDAVPAFYATQDWQREFRRYVNVDRSEVDVAGDIRAAVQSMMDVP